MTPIIGITASSITASTLGDFESIATASLGTAGTVSFQNIPATYKHLQIRFLANNENSANYKIALRLNNDSGSNYDWHWLEGTGTAAQAGRADEFTAMRLVPGNFSTTNWTVGIIDILDYANTSKNTTARALGGYDTNGGGRLGLSSALWINTAAVNRIDILPFLGNYVAGSHFALYGIK